MLAIIYQAINRKKVALMVYCLASLLFLMMYVGMYPSIGEQAEQFEQIFNSYPEEIFSALNIDSLSFDTLEKFLALENFSIVWPLMVMFFMVSFAGASLAGEIEKGTIGLVLARPMSRLKIFFSRYITGLAILVIFSLCSILAAAPIASMFNIEYVFANHVTMLVLGLLFGWAVFSLSMFVSSIFSEKSKVYMTMGGLFFSMYVLNILANLRESIEELRYLSCFYYFDYSSAIIENVIHWETYFVFSAIILITTITGAMIFNKRDISI